MALVLMMVVIGSGGPGPAPIARADDCAGLNAQAYQPQYAEATDALLKASTASLGGNYPSLPSLKSGAQNPTLVSPFIPCIILRSIGWAESGWKQAVSSVPRGSTGPALTAYTGCGYGFMQITSVMTSPGAIDPTTQRRIAEEYRYNIGYGASMLAGKWNSSLLAGSTTVGNRNPTIAEDWYYATWAYNYWSFRNNPNNPDYPWPRPPSPRSWPGSPNGADRPYQELVWWWAANPPAPGGSALWPAVALTLPDRALVGLNHPPNSIPDPQPVHTGTCGAALAVSPTTLTFLTGPSGAYSPATVTVGGTGSYAWTASASQGWLEVSPRSGTSAPATLQVSIRGTPPAGWSTATITIQASGDVWPSRQDIAVRVYVGQTYRLYFPWVSRK